MPYIKEEDRQRVINHGPENCGELNYALTIIINEYLGGNPRYQHYCEVEGVLGHIAKELYRRRTVPYEDLKIKENGDVY